MAERKLSRHDALTRLDLRHACHILLYSDTNKKLFRRIPIKHVVLMQMRFDGLLGFPGGLVDPSKETLEAGLTRELHEELGVALPVTIDDYVCSEISQSKTQLILHFYIKKIQEAELVEIERAAVNNAVDHGLEVMGMVRVPLYTLRRGGGLPLFLSHSFIGNARDQLLEALQRLNLVSPWTLTTAIKEAEEKRRTF